MHTTVPMLESGRTVRLTPLGTATVAAYRLLRALRALPDDSARAEVLALIEEELAALQA